MGAAVWAGEAAAAVVAHRWGQVQAAEAETGAAAAGETAGDEGVMGGEEEAGEGEGEGAEAGARAGDKISVPSEPYRYFKFKPRLSVCSLC